MDDIDGVDFGLSIVLCSHNGASRIDKTLQSIATQVVPGNLKWELVVVDNGSTDNTADIVRSGLAPHQNVHLRLISEATPGLTFARLAGLTEARFQYVAFVDDDNSLPSTWVETAYDVMTNNPDVGACGGPTRLPIGTTTPSWFQAVAGSYAVGRLHTHTGRIGEQAGYLWGAGLTVRRAPLLQILKSRPGVSLSDRTGLSLDSGGDSELCYLLRINGWALWYDLRLEMVHRVPEDRLTWDYAIRLHKGFGRASVHLDPYISCLKGRDSGWRRHLEGSWITRAAWTTLKLLRHPQWVTLAAFRRGVGNPPVLRVHMQVARIATLLHLRSRYRMQYEATVRGLSPVEHQPSQKA